MKKILGAIVMIGLAYGANAQSSKTGSCGTKQNHVCRPSKDKKSVSCYKTDYAENFKVCKNDHGYFICCQEPGLNNSTYRGVTVNRKAHREETQYVSAGVVYDARPVDMTVPQSQSYVNTDYSFYEGSYVKTGKKACYMGSNVAANNRAPYEGCPSPQSDGPDANKQRNLNVSNPVSMPPLTGQAK